MSSHLAFVLQARIPMRAAILDSNLKYHYLVVAPSFYFGFVILPSTNGTVGLLRTGWVLPHASVVLALARPVLFFL